MGFILNIQSLVSCFHSFSRVLIITLQGILAINQDSLGKAATTFNPSGAASPVSGQLYPYWAGQLSDGVVVALVAPSGAQTLSVNFSDVPGLGSGTFSWTELYSGHTGSGASVSASLGAHDIAIFKVIRGGSQTSVPSTTVPTTTVPSTTIASTLGSTSTGKPCGAIWTQCGGQGWTGPTCCQSGSTCKFSNDCELFLHY